MFNKCSHYIGLTVPGMCCGGNPLFIGPGDQADIQVMTKEECGGGGVVPVGEGGHFK